MNSRRQPAPRVAWESLIISTPREITNRPLPYVPRAHSDLPGNVRLVYQRGVLDSAQNGSSAPRDDARLALLIPSAEALADGRERAQAGRLGRPTMPWTPPQQAMPAHAATEPGASAG